MVSRNRSTCGVRPYIRATCNPDADSWVANFLAPWIDPETGFPIPERVGVLRYYVRVAEKIVWADRPEDLRQYLPQPKDLPPGFDPLRPILALGEHLFEDHRLSGDGSRACSSCHDVRTNGADGNSGAVIAVRVVLHNRSSAAALGHLGAVHKRGAGAKTARSRRSSAIRTGGSP